MRTRIFAAVLLLFVASSARAQPTTAEGIDAFLRGDYQRAADILKPIAEQSPNPDHVAEFFMGTLYDSGLGVTADPLRACASYMRASADRGPFGMQAMALLATRPPGGDAYQECMWRVMVGFDHRFEPVTFALGPGHWIAWDLKGATITYDGKEKRVPLSLARNRAIFLPLGHTEIAAGPTRATRRHFIEIFTWLPGTERQTWTLMWSLMEVVRSDVIRVASEQLATISAPEPPAAASFDVRQIVRLGVTDDGDAEWTLGGPSPRTTVIESDADRADQEDETRRRHAREAADARVDWKRTVDPHRSPALAYVDASICGRAFVYGWSADRTEAITVRADKDLRDLAVGAGTFDLGQNGGFEVTLHVTQWPVQSWPFCSDVGWGSGLEETWRATKGSVTVEVLPRVADGRVRTAYRATIRIVGAEFVNGAGVRVEQVHPIALTAFAR